MDINGAMIERTRTMVERFPEENVVVDIKKEDVWMVPDGDDREFSLHCLAETFNDANYALLALSDPVTIRCQERKHIQMRIQEGLEVSWQNRELTILRESNVFVS